MDTKTKDNGMVNSQDDYLKKEFDKLNKELDSLLTEARSRERYSLTVLAVTSAWMYTQIFVNHNNGGIIKAISFIPLVIVIMYGISVVYIYKNIKWIGEYLTRIEDHFLKNFTDDKGISFGWEKFFASDDADKKRQFVKVTYLFWGLQVILAAVLAVITVFT